MSADRPAGPAQQLRNLTDFGVRLRPGVTEGDVLAALGPSARSGPVSHADLLAVLAADMGLDGQPDPEALSTNVGAFDTEFVEDPDAYDWPVRFMAAVAGRSPHLSDVVSAIDVEAGEGTLSYVVDGRPRTWDVEVDDDWGDAMVLSYVLDDLVAGTGTDVVQFSVDQNFGFVVVASSQREALQALLDPTADA